jgi:uncharacterized protein YbjT (DUF2867 family)
MKMKNVIITGSTGMVGSLALQLCLVDPEIGKVTALVRRLSGITHPKLTEVVVPNFLDFSAVSHHFAAQDVCLFCIGVYTGTVTNEVMREITVDYTRVFATLLHQKSPAATFCFLSGQGADPSGKSSMAFAKYKGEAENLLQNLHFGAFYTFRPGYIYPSVPRTEPNFSYKVMRVLYKPVAAIYPNIGLTSAQLAAAMVKAGLHGAPQNVLENKDIKML